MGKWTQAQMEALADRFAQIFVEAVKHAGGTATIVDSAAAQQAVADRPATLPKSEEKSQHAGG